MNSKDEQDDFQNRLLKLPVELHYAISSYLSTLNIKNLSQTAIELRSVYHPILYRNCKVSEQHEGEIISKRYWMISSWILFEPSNYSWFPNQAVQNIVVNDQFSIIELKYYIKPSDYPSLTSFKVVLETYRSQLVTTLQHPISFVERNMSFPHLSTNDFLSVVKSDERLHTIKCSKKHRPYYVLQCSKKGTRSMITSLNLNIIKRVQRRQLEGVSNIAKELKAYANLKDLKIWCSDKFNYKPLKRLIDLVTKLESLDSLMIHYQITTQGTRYLNLLDNLKGSWKTFNLCLDIFVGFPTSELFLRLPTVTNLIMDSNEYFKGKLEFGSNIKELEFPFHSDSEFLPEYHRVQNVLDNLTTLKVAFTSIYDTSFYEKGIKIVVFTKVLPNLKAFKIQMYEIETMSNNQLNPFSELFGMFFSLIPFGEFDILNYESIKPYILQLKTAALETWKKSYHFVKIIEKCADSLEKANKDSNMYDLYQNFFFLQFKHSGSIHRLRGDIWEKKFLGERAIISVLLLQLLQYTPNLETLTMLGVPLHEEFAAFHRLIKYHKHLKTVSARLIRIDDMSFNNYKNHEIYSRYRLFVKPVLHKIHDNQVFTEPTRSNDGSFGSGIEYDIEGFREGHVYNFSSSPDKELDRYKPGKWNECIFTESLPLNINELQEYIYRLEFISPD